MHISYILNHLGEERSSYFNAIAPPIIQSSNFAFHSIADFRNAIADELNHHIYTRGNNPTVAILRKKLAALEHTEDTLVFGSGAAAIATAIIGNVKSGDHIICVSNPYSWTYKLLTLFLPRFGVTHTFVDGTNINSFHQAIQERTTLLYLESPNSLTFELQDIKAWATLAKKHGIISCIDNSYATPLFQQAAKMGVDIVLHSGTKYLNGHSDVVFGALCSSKKIVQKLFDSELMTLGAILAPHDAALVIRGLRTLEIRMKQINESCHKVVSFLETHPKVERIYFPFSKKHPQYELAKTQMSGTGGLFSILLKAQDISAIERFFSRLERFLLAVSWGGHDSQILPICGLYNIPGKPNPDLPWNLVRFYIGLENPDWLIEDLEQALSVL